MKTPGDVTTRRVGYVAMAKLVTWLRPSWLRDWKHAPCLSLAVEKQARYRARNVVWLTADAHAIVDKLVEMADQGKLLQIAGLVKENLHPTDGRCRWVKDDGGRRKSGIARAAARKDEVGDCVVRAIGIATGRPYREVHDALTVAKVRHIYQGGTATALGQKLRLRADELPRGKLSPPPRRRCNRPRDPRHV
jgi:hypothetical protein